MSQEQAMPTTGRWGWYRDHEGRDVRRVSKLLEWIETKPNRYNIERWQERQVAIGLAARADLLLAVKALGPEPEGGWTRDQKDQLTKLAGQAQEAAKSGAGAIAGTAVHTLTERVDRGEPIDRVVAGLDPVSGRTLRAYEAMRRLNGWRVVEIERTVWLEEFEVRGTFDRIDLVPGLTALLGPDRCQHAADHAHEDHEELPVVVDVKTEKDPSLNGIHITPQLAIYSRARKMWRPTGGTRVITVSGQDVEVPNGEYVPTPCVRQDVAIVVHLRDGDANPLFVNLTEGWEAATAANEQRLRESRAKRRMGAVGAWFAPVPGVRQPAPAELLVAEAVAAGEGRPDRPGPGQVGEAVSVGGIKFTRKLADSTCNNCAPLMFGASATRVDGTEGHSLCRDCGAAVGEVATRGADGLVRWEPTAAPAAAPAAVADAAIAAVWRAVTIDDLSAVWREANAVGRAWSGALAMAGDARRRQIECPQRALHAGGNGGRCACGWMDPQIP